MEETVKPVVSDWLLLYQFYVLLNSCPNQFHFFVIKSVILLTGKQIDSIFLQPG